MGTASAGLFLGSAALSTVQDTPGSASLTTSEQQIGLRLQQEEAGGQVLVIEDQAATPLHRLPLDAGKVRTAGWREGVSEQRCLCMQCRRRRRP